MIDLFSSFAATPMRERLIDVIEHQKEVGEQELLEEVETEFAYQILYGQKYYVTHRNDPPWDCSGELHRSQDNYNIDDYETLCEYMEEYNGNSEASYCSGIGFFHKTRKDDFEEILDEHAVFWLKEAIREIITSEDKEKLLDFLLEQEYTDIEDSEIAFVKSDDELIDILANGIYGECNIDLIHEQMDRLEKVNTRFLYGKGEKIAQDQRALEIKIEEEKAQQKEVESERATIIWGKIEKLYRLQKQKEIPEKIEMDSYGEFKEFLDYNQISQEERVLIAFYHGCSFSNNAGYRLMGVIT